MNKRTLDINHRFAHANAERSMYYRGTKCYEQLTEIIKFILSEYGGNNHAIRSRYSFRMYDGGYHLVCLSKDEAE